MNALAVKVGCNRQAPAGPGVQVLPSGAAIGTSASPEPEGLRDVIAR